MGWDVWCIWLGNVLFVLCIVLFERSRAVYIKWRWGDIELYSCCAINGSDNDARLSSKV